MDTKSIAITAVFASLTVALNPAFSHISIPAPFFPYISYEIWEIPLVVVFLLVGFKEGLLVAIVNGLILLSFFPYYITIGSVIASLSMLTGIYLAYRLLTRKAPQETALLANKSVIGLTVGGIIFRTFVMAIQNYVFLPYPSPLGMNLPQPVVLSIMPLIAIFNVTEPLYVVPIGYLITKAIKKTQT